jgi:transcriptional regulator with XRE-family HTH domain
MVRALLAPFKLPPKVVGEQLRAERKRRSLTLEQLSVSVGVHYTQISRYERGKFSRASAENLQKLCTFLGVPRKSGSELDALCRRLRETAHTAAQRQAVAALLDAIDEINDA